MKATEEQIEEIKIVYENKGLNGVNGYLKRKGIDYERFVKWFGNANSQKTIEEKKEWLKYNEERTLRFHYASISCSHNGGSFNMSRGVEYVF